VTGLCGNCLSADTICSQLVVTRFSKIKNRIKVILIGEESGY
ncbi:MAG: lactate utilization protein, partial [Clostridiales bacterium]|nr:lactate utilization protein [Clostridiales bacterium]